MCLPRPAKPERLSPRTAGRAAAGGGAQPKRAKSMSSSSSSWTSSFFASCAAGAAPPAAAAAPPPPPPPPPAPGVAEVLARQHLREKLREHRVNRAAGALHQRVEVRGTHLCFGILKDERRIRQEEFIAHRGSQIARSPP